MADLEHLPTSTNELSSDELQTVYWLIPGENLKKIQTIMQAVYEQTDTMDEVEINTAIDEALSEVRLEHKNRRTIERL